LPVRLKDIARDLDLSTVTISKVLRGSSDIGQATRERVLQRMKELNYRPNYSARALASGRTYSIGLVVPDMVNPYFAQVAAHLRSELRKTGQVLIVTSSDEDPELEREEIRALQDRGVDVLIIASCQTKLEKPTGTKTPFLLIDRNHANLHANFLGLDDAEAGRIATQHLIDTGHHRVAHIGTRRLSPGKDRLRGYRATLKKNNIEVPAEYIVLPPKFEAAADKAGYEAMRKLLQLPEPPNAVFCYNDLSALGAMEAAREAKLSIPKHIAFAGCGNFPYSRYLATPLTSIDQSPAELSKAVAELAQAILSNPKMQPQKRLIAPQLVVRTSSVR
jgi:LacI family transcriptional regulator